MSRTRKVFTTQFKQECVNLVVNQGYGVSQAAKAMNVGLSSIQRWVAQYQQEIKGVLHKPGRLHLSSSVYSYLKPRIDNSSEIMPC